jgi:chromosome segregation protein
MHAWQEEWNEFNQRAAERAQAAQVERTRLDHLDRHMQQLDDRLQRMDEEQQTLGKQSVAGELEQLAHASGAQETVVTGNKVSLDAAVRNITDIRSGLEQQEQELAALQSVHHDSRGQLASLETLQQAALGQRSEQLTGWLTAQGLQGAPRLAQEIQVEPGWEHAVETALGCYLEAVCVDGLDHAGQMLGSLEQGTLALFDTGVTAAANAPADKGVPLGSKVNSSWSVGALLDGIYAVETLPQALANRAGLAVHESIITRDGIWVGKNWLRVARDTDEKAGVLQRERDISELTAQLAVQLASVDTLLQSVAAARESLVTAEHERDRLQDEYNQALRRASELRAELAAVQARLEQQQSRRDHVMMESEVLRTEKESEAQAMASSQGLLQEALTAVETLSVEREERTRQQQQFSSVLDETRERARSDQQTVHALALRAESMRTAQETTSQALTRMREQCQQLIGRRDQLTGVLDQGDTPIVELQTELEVLLSSRHEVEAELNTARKQVEDIEHGTRELDQERIRKERSVSSQREQIEQQRMAWQEIKVRSDTLLEQINESGFEHQPLLEQLAEDASVDVWAERADKLERRIQRLGPINLAAIEEYEEESKRKEYLDAQHIDLTEALATLENAMGKIDRETRTRFKETFDQVNEGLQENFPALFGGGQAYLELTGDDLLDTGVTVMARPPGKRNSTIHLLSGGEKAMTAIALVFAIFRLNPSPFCMLDEVDAPLDDANVGRYCDMVRKMSQHVQFIFISHNKVTMEMANQLTGVTMHEPGVSRLVAVDIDAAVKLAAV